MSISSTQQDAAEVRAAFEEIVRSIFAAKKLPAPAIRDETLLLDGTIPIDSLDLAEIVVRMTEACRCDPFKDGFVPFQTAGELIRLYAQTARVSASDI
jgi:acyl carrier protein